MSCFLTPSHKHTHTPPPSFHFLLPVCAGLYRGLASAESTLLAWSSWQSPHTVSLASHTDHWWHGAQTVCVCVCRGGRGATRWSLTSLTYMYVTSLKPMLGYFFPVQSLGSPRNPSTDNLIYPLVSQATPFVERKGLVTLQPLSCCYSRNLLWPMTFVTVLSSGVELLLSC